VIDTFAKAMLIATVMFGFGILHIISGASLRYAPPPADRNRKVYNLRRLTQYLSSPHGSFELEISETIDLPEGSKL
jgi:hypothetical protein